jgi:hypothetical protein
MIRNFPEVLKLQPVYYCNSICNLAVGSSCGCNCDSWALVNCDHSVGLCPADGGQTSPRIMLQLSTSPSSNLAHAPPFIQLHPLFHYLTLVLHAAAGKSLVAHAQKRSLYFHRILKGTNWIMEFMAAGGWCRLPSGALALGEPAWTLNPSMQDGWLKDTQCCRQWFVILYFKSSREEHNLATTIGVTR